MKIAVLIDAWFPHIGGGQVHAYELAKNLAQRHGVTLEIITRRIPGTAWKDDKKNIKIVKFGPSLPFENIFGRILYLVQSFIHLLTRKYDLIHVHAFSPGPVAKLIGVLKKTPVIMTIHGTSVEGFKNEKLSFREKIFLRLEKWILFEIKYDAQISVSGDVLNISNVNKNIFVVPTGADITIFQHRNITKDKDFKIIFVGRLQRQKGIKYLIEAMSNVHKQYPRVKLVIVGNGSEGEFLTRQAKNLPFIIFKSLGKEDLVNEMLSSRLFVLPSLYEGSPIVLFEAWGAKLPVVATRVGGIPDFVRDGVNGYLVTPKDPQALASAIIKAIKNKNLTKMGENGFKIAEKQTWGKMSDQVYKIFEKYGKN